MIIDIIILLLLVWAVINGIRRGFIAQLIAIISLILGVWLSCRFATLLGDWSAEKLHTDAHLMKFICFALIFVIVVFGLFWLGKFIERTIKILMLSWLNKLLGVVFALIKFLLVIGLLLILFDTFNNDLHLVPQSYLESSHLYFPVRNATSGVFPYLRDLLTVF